MARNIPASALPAICQGGAGPRCQMGGPVSGTAVTCWAVGPPVGGATPDPRSQPGRARGLREAGAARAWLRAVGHEVGSGSAALAATPSLGCAPGRGQGRAMDWPLRHRGPRAGPAPVQPSVPRSPWLLAPCPCCVPGLGHGARGTGPLGRVSMQHRARCLSRASAPAALLWARAVCTPRGRGPLPCSGWGSLPCRSRWARTRGGAGAAAPPAPSALRPCWIRWLLQAQARRVLAGPTRFPLCRLPFLCPPR